MLFPICMMLVGSLAAAPASAQEQQAWKVSHSAFVDDELETYLRNLQILGKSPLYPWSIRSFSVHEVERLAPADSAHPWAQRFDFSGDAGPPFRFRVIAPEAELFYNTAFPYGHNDGPVWAGRGLTSSIRAGFFAAAGPLSLTFAPIAFRAENADFDLEVNRRPGLVAFQDTRSSGIDLPQRFGNEPYARVDPGESTLRLDLVGAALGISTAAQHWGPAVDYPLLLGKNAGGFPHVFFGTSRPLDVWVGSLHTRIVWGRLVQSDYSPVQEGEDRRFASGLVAVFSPAFFTGLEVGAARFFHTTWPAGGIEGGDLLKPLQGILKSSVGGAASDAEGENQLASIFARWAVPAGGVEVYGEFYREDHSYDLRDLTLEPDHISGYTVGLRKAWEISGADVLAMRAELSDTEISHLSQVRHQSRIYGHGRVRQGHTQRGQLLGSYAGLGGGGSTLAVNWYRAGGRLSALWSRELVDEKAGLRDVIHAFGVEGLFFWGDLEVGGGLTSAYELNRRPGVDEWNLNAQLLTRYRF